MKNFFIIATLVGIALAGCEKEEKRINVTGVALNKNTLTLTEGDTVTLFATVTPEKATNKVVAWTSNDTSVAKVNANGLVTAIEKGNTTITVTADDGAQKADCAITVNAKADPTLNLSASEICFDYTAEIKEVTVTANIDWTVSSTAEWIIIAPAEGNGNATLNISVSENTEISERSADIVISQVGSGGLSATLKANQKAITLEQQARMQDSLALIAFYDATNGDEWTNKIGWKTAPLEQWHGITVENDRVVQINLFNNKLAGSIPAEIGNLFQLQELHLGYNQLSSRIPAEIGNLIQLETLLLFSNQLTGEIPSEIGNLSHLQTLNPNYALEISGKFTG